VFTLGLFGEKSFIFENERPKENDFYSICLKKNDMKKVLKERSGKKIQDKKMLK
jgi:hypothetical protein